MRYFYVDENDHTAGPVEEASFYEALRIGVLTSQTEVVAEGTEEWQTLGAILPYYFTFGDDRAGPLPLAKLESLAAASDEPLMVMEPGMEEWQSLESLLSAAADVQESAPPPPPSPAEEVVLTHAGAQASTGSEGEAALTAIRELRAENGMLKLRLAALEERVEYLEAGQTAVPAAQVPN